MPNSPIKKPEIKSVKPTRKSEKDDTWSRTAERRKQRKRKGTQSYTSDNFYGRVNTDKVTPTGEPYKSAWRFVPNKNLTPEQNEALKKSMEESFRAKVPSLVDAKSPQHANATSKLNPVPSTPESQKVAPDATPETPASVLIDAQGKKIYKAGKIFNGRVYDNISVPLPMSPPPPKPPEEVLKSRDVKKKLDFGSDPDVIEPEMGIKRQKTTITEYTTTKVKKELRDNPRTSQSRAVVKPTGNVKNASATKYAHRTLPIHVKGTVGKDRVYEWAHCLPHSKLGIKSQDVHNLMCVIPAMNTCMGFAEKHVLKYCDKTYPKGYKLEVEAYLLYIEKNGEWVPTHMLDGEIKWSIKIDGLPIATLPIDPKLARNYPDGKPHKDFAIYVENSFIDYIKLCELIRTESNQPQAPTLKL